MPPPEDRSLPAPRTGTTARDSDMASDSPPELESISESELTAGLQPIRHLFLAHALFTFLRTGLCAHITSNPNSEIETIAEKFSVDVDRLTDFLEYLANESIVTIRTNAVSIAAAGQDLQRVEPWYNLLVGGYAKSLLQLADCLRNSRLYAERDGNYVGVGSNAISRHDAIPMTKRLITAQGPSIGTIVDVGCGEGSYLIELCAGLPHVVGIGIDPQLPNLEDCITKAHYAEVGDRVTFFKADASYAARLKTKAPVCYLFAFVLQEMLEQSGRRAVVSLLQELVGEATDATAIVIEVDHRAADGYIRSHPLGLAYYNPYYLIHSITEQRLETRKYWLEVFEEANCEVAASTNPDPQYDSLELKVGFFIRRRG